MSRFPPRPFAPTFISPHRSGWHRTKAIQKATGVTGCSYTTRLFEVVRDLMPPPRQHRRDPSRSLGGRDENGQLSGDRAPRMTTHLGVIARRFIWSVTDLQRFAIPARDSLSLRSLGIRGRGDPEQPAINERAGSGGSSVSAALVVTDAAYEGGHYIRSLPCVRARRWHGQVPIAGRLYFANRRNGRIRTLSPLRPLSPWNPGDARRRTPRRRSLAGAVRLP